MRKEVWKDISGYEGLYQVSNFGRVKSLDRFIYASSVFGKNKFIRLSGRILKGRYSKVKKKGYVNYPRVCLLKNGVGKQYCIHKLVAKEFILNPNGLKQVDHIDGDSLNNRVENLRWCSQKENNNNPISRKRRSLLLDGNIAKDIAIKNGISARTFHSRIFQGWSLRDAVTKPVRKRFGG